jgi:hypothetical protein
MLSSDVKKDLEGLKRTEVHSTAEEKNHLRRGSLSMLYTRFGFIIENLNDGSSRQKTAETLCVPCWMSRSM